MIHFYIKMYISWVYNLIPLKAHMCRESISTTNTTCNFFFSWTWTDAAGAPSFRQVLQSHKIPKAPPAQTISLFPVPQTLNFHIPALLTRSPAQPSYHPLPAPPMLAEVSRSIPSSRPGTFSKSHRPCLVTHLSQFLCHPRVVAISLSSFTAPLQTSSLDPWRVISWAPPLSTTLHWHLLQGGSCFGYRHIQGESDFSLT